MHGVAYDAFVRPHKCLVGIKGPKVKVILVIWLAPANHAGISAQAATDLLCLPPARRGLCTQTWITSSVQRLSFQVKGADMTA